MKYASLDIDGPISTYPQCWIDYININTKSNFKSKIEAKENIGIDKYKELKHSYRLSDYKADLPINDNIYIVIENLQKLNYKILLMTSRPFKFYPELFKNTKNWLERNNISFDHLLQKSENNIKKFPGIKFHLDDEIKQCVPYLKNEIPCFIINSKIKPNKSKLVTYLDNTVDLIKYIE
tara:strand:- start:514 stop:1050 length:537 start_codon:yes stop_codon:yes gene_type:complete